jgi:hypothetical protein
LIAVEGTKAAPFIAAAASRTFSPTEPQVVRRVCLFYILKPD